MTQLDLAYNQRTAIIGTAIANYIFKGQDPIGKTMKIIGQELKVVGVRTQTEGGVVCSKDDEVYIPVSIAGKLGKSAVIRRFSVEATSADTVDQSVTKVYSLPWMILSFGISLLI